MPLERADPAQRAAPATGAGHTSPSAQGHGNGRQAGSAAKIGVENEVAAHAHDEAVDRGGRGGRPEGPVLPGEARAHEGSVQGAAM